MRTHLAKQAYGLIPDYDARLRLESAPKLPLLMGDLWALYFELSARRSISEHGAVRFTWTDIKDFCLVKQRFLSEWQLSVIEKIENEYFAVELANRPK